MNFKIKEFTLILYAPFYEKYAPSIPHLNLIQGTYKTTKYIGLRELEV